MRTIFPNKEAKKFLNHIRRTGITLNKTWMMNVEPYSIGLDYGGLFCSR